MKLANIQTHTFLITRESVSFGVRVGMSCGAGGGGGDLIQTYESLTIPLQLWVISPCQPDDSNFMEPKSSSEEGSNPSAISFPFINGISRHQWSQSISVCCQPTGRVWPKSLLMAAKLSVTTLSRCTTSPAQAATINQTTRSNSLDRLYGNSNHQCKHDRFGCVQPDSSESRRVSDMVCLEEMLLPVIC